jgi:uncharacterized protein
LIGVRHGALWLCLFILAVLVSACSDPLPGIKVDGAGKPALWKVTSDNNISQKGTVWLFGTVHLLPPGTDWQTAQLDEAMRAADRLVLEVSGLDDNQAVADIFAQMAISGGLPKLAMRVDPALHPVLDKLDAAIAGPRAVLDHMESWAAALTLASAMSADLSLSKSAGVEQILTLRFRGDDKPISGLETVSQQFGYFNNLPERDQRAMLNAVLRSEATNRATFQKLLSAWMDGRADAVLDDAQDGILASPAIKDALLDQRNRNWAVQIGAMVDRGDSVFVAVGAGHLAGKSGVPERMKAAGYHVVRVQ